MAAGELGGFLTVVGRCEGRTGVAVVRVSGSTIKKKAESVTLRGKSAGRR